MIIWLLVLERVRQRVCTMLKSGKLHGYENIYMKIYTWKTDANVKSCKAKYILNDVNSEFLSWLLKSLEYFVHISLWKLRI